MSLPKEVIHPFPGRLGECNQCQKQTDIHDGQFPCSAIIRASENKIPVGMLAWPIDEKERPVDAVFPGFGRQKGCSSVRPKSS